MLLHRFPDHGAFGDKIQEAELDYLFSSQRGDDVAGRELRGAAVLTDNAFEKARFRPTPAIRPTPNRTSNLARADGHMAPRLLASDSVHM